MDFSKLRHRVIFLKPLDKRLNSMNENVPVWIPFKPKLSSDINADETSVYVLTDNKGNAVWKSAGGGQLYSHQLSLNEYAVWQMFLRCRDVSMRSHKNCVQKPHTKLQQGIFRI